MCEWDALLGESTNDLHCCMVVRCWVFVGRCSVAAWACPCDNVHVYSSKTCLNVMLLSFKRFISAKAYAELINRALQIVPELVVYEMMCMMLLGWFSYIIQYICICYMNCLSSSFVWSHLELDFSI